MGIFSDSRLTLHRYHAPYWQGLLEWIGILLGFYLLLTLFMFLFRAIDPPANDFGNHVGNTWIWWLAIALSCIICAVPLATWFRDRYEITEEYIRRKSLFGKLQIHFSTIRHFEQLNGSHLRIWTGTRERDVYVHPVAMPDVLQRIDIALAKTLEATPPRPALSSRRIGKGYSR